MARAVLLGEIEFVPPAVDRVVEQMAALAAVGHGWVNLQPAVPDTEVPPRRGAAWLLASAPDPVPVCSWVVGGRAGRRRLPKSDQVGVQHGAGARALGQLAVQGVRLPDGWRCRQDNARRGLVLELPAGTDPEVALTWMLSAGAALATVPLAGPWRARIHGEPPEG
jgi:hypothetical protein